MEKLIYPDKKSLVAEMKIHCVCTVIINLLPYRHSHTHTHRGLCTNFMPSTFVAYKTLAKLNIIVITVLYIQTMNVWLDAHLTVCQTDTLLRNFSYPFWPYMDWQLLKLNQTYNVSCALNWISRETIQKLSNDELKNYAKYNAHFTYFNKLLIATETFRRFRK